MEPVVRVPGLAVRAGEARAMTRALPEEAAVAMVYDGSTQAVLMATPRDLEDFGVGFSLTEGIVARPEEIESLEVIEQGPGIEVRMWLAGDRAEALAGRRRFMAGPVGCGLCGLESLGAALRPVPPVAGAVRLSAAEIEAAVAALSSFQPLHDETQAVHAAAFWRPGSGIVAAFEDVGRHNALDKLVGALARRGEPAAGGVVILTSRVSIDMVQKVAVAGAGVVVGVSAPTAHAVRLADEAGMTLVALAREDGFCVFTHPGRVEMGARDVA
ncbi:MAG: formate dehydrogenase accessory sulfurtransferase FdhD [Amaricoccus sp.]|nr:formate dehydrogenase accessory sulfurtransferase FdhD [Amaricoccus sp.]